MLRLLQALRFEFALVNDRVSFELDMWEETVGLTERTPLLSRTEEEEIMNRQVRDRQAIRTRHAQERHHFYWNL
ncbi:MAG: hypothetical protein AAF549_05515 [Pseudomonadota bacterium]